MVHSDFVVLGHVKSATFQFYKDTIFQLFHLTHCFIYGFFKYPLVGWCKT